jgi:acyl carrier protein
LSNVIESIVYESIAEVNEDLEISELENPSLDTKLFELIDSLGTLDLIMELENRLQSKYGKYIQVATENSMDIDKTEFKDVNSLIQYLNTKV